MYRSIDPDEDLVLKQVITDRFALAPADRGYSWREVLPTEKRTPHHRHHRHPRHRRHPLLPRRRRRRHRQLPHRPADLPQRRRKPPSSPRKTASSSPTSPTPSPARSPSPSTTAAASAFPKADLYLLIEKALLENEAYDVAKSLAFRRSMEKTGTVDVHTGPHAAARPPDPPQWQRRPVVRDQDRDRR